MPTPKKGYFLKDGTKIPGTTTITGRTKESGGLVHWAWDLGMKGISYRDFKDEAALVGTTAHAMVEADIKGKSIDEIIANIDAEICVPAMRSYEAYKVWAANFSVEIKEQEIQLVSEKYQYGGTPDAVGLVGGKLALLDWKTSKSVYKDMRMQLAAYLNLWNENFPDNPITGGAHLLVFSKTRSGEFSHHFYPDLSREFECFKAARVFFQKDKEMDE